MNSYRPFSIPSLIGGFVADAHPVGLVRVLRNFSKVGDLRNRIEPSDHSFLS